ncbi:MAG: glycoside hydrolase family 31 protein [Armatimonadota bacterium]
MQTRLLCAVIAEMMILAACGQVAADNRSVVDGNARFQVLASGIVRMEYSPTAKFTDAASSAVIGRDQSTDAKFESKTVDGWLNIKTDKMTVKYKAGSGPFTKDNLLVEWQDAGSARSWKPGDKDEQNLGGVPGDIAHRLVPVADPGPLSRSGYYFFDDSRTPVWNKSIDWIEPRPEKDSQDWYFFVYGRDYAGMLKSLSNLTGSIPMVPRYVLGSWFGSRTGYNADEWKIITRRFREEQIPMDVMVLDSCSWTDVVWSGYDWDHEQMPDPPGFFKWMNENGVHVTLNEHYAPITKDSDKNFETIRNEMGLPADTKEINHDLSNKKYAGLFANLLLKPALDMGMAFWWQDGCSPVTMENLDPMMWTREVEYNAAEKITGKRSYVFCRLGTTGSHRSGSFFSGDLVPEWKALEMLVPFNVRAANMLVAYPTNLTNAVFGVNIDPELYVRWTQFGAFSPILWVHGIWGLRLPWEYGEPGMGVCADFIRLRERLIPYTYTYSRIANETGVSLVRGMYIDYPNQEQSYAYSDKQYMYGRDMLIAPITESANGKAALKDIYLPEGDNWYDYFTGEIYTGGQVVNYECPLDRMPMFVRAGSIIPMAPQMNYAGEKPLDPLTLDVYAGDRAASFKLFEDDGESLDYRQGKFAWTNIEFAPKGSAGTYELKIDPAVGKFKGQLKNRRYEILMHGLLKPDAIELNGKKLRESAGTEWLGDWSYDAKTRVTTVRLRDALPISDQAVLRFVGAGTFADSQMLQKTIEFRDRIRLVKHDEKLKYALVLAGREHAKPPRVILKTEEVENQLDSLVASPKGISKNAPDFKAMAAQVLNAFTDKPFDSTRAIPDKNPTCVAASEYLDGIRFEDEEISRMTAILLGLELPSRFRWDAPAPSFGQAYLHLYTKLNFDAGLIGKPEVKYAIELPQDYMPGWGQMPPAPDANGYTRFDIFTPNPAKPQGQSFRVKATLKWDTGEVTLHRDIQWK